MSGLPPISTRTYTLFPYTTLFRARCMVAAGARSDYDRSGGHAITMVGEGLPIEVPNVEVAPADGLADGSVVAVSGNGFTPNEVVSISVCSADPATRWQRGPKDRPCASDEGDQGSIAHRAPALAGQLGMPVASAGGAHRTHGGSGN